MDAIDEGMRMVNECYGWNVQLKDKQKEVIKNVIEGRHTVAILPTGYGKSMTYMLPPLILDEVCNT